MNAVMGLYIDYLPNGTPLESLDKAGQLIRAGVAHSWGDKVKSLNTVPPGKIAVVVIQNGMFDAALVMVKEEWQERHIPDRLRRDMRPYNWLLMNVEDAAKGAKVSANKLI